jgi:protein gp37
VKFWSSACAGTSIQGFDLRLVPEKLAEPLRWCARKTVFVNSMSDLFHSMSDLFHDDVPDDYICAVAKGDRDGGLAHVPGAHEALGAHGRASENKAAIRQ